MSENHDEVVRLIEESIEFMDRAANIVTETRIEPVKPVLKNIAMGMAELLHAKKRVIDHSHGNESQ